MNASNDIFEVKEMYDGSRQTIDCGITSQNAGLSCTFTVHVNAGSSSPLFVYYELENYYQNHRRYVSSRSANQLEGQDLPKTSLTANCPQKIENGSLLLNPCGLIANSFFTDTISLTASTPSGYVMTENGISWPSDSGKFGQVTGFQSALVSGPSATCASVNLSPNCKTYLDPQTGQYYKFEYPKDDTVQYLYETYPDQISPLQGVTNEHFIVWMRTAALPKFRKLYGKISGDFTNGVDLAFTIVANYEVSSFGGSKTLVVSTIGEFGGSNPHLGTAYIVVGVLSLITGLLFAAKHILNPRPIGDITMLQW